MFGTGTMSTDTQANQPSGPVDDFAARIAQHRVAGYGRHTIIAWLLYALVVTDALLNAMGSGAVTMSILDTIAEGVSLDGKTLTFVLCSLQLAVLGWAAFEMSRSPWRRWLGTALRQTWSVDAVLRAMHFSLRRDWPGIALYVVTYLALSPLLGAFVQGNRGVAFAALAVIGFVGIGILALAMFGLEIALISRARHDASTAAGLAAGFLIPVVFFFPFVHPAVLAHALGSDLVLFERYQLFILAVALIGIWIVAFGSVNSNDAVVPLDLSRGGGDIVSELPDISHGFYSEFRFQITQGDQKLLLLFSESETSPDYEVMSLRTAHNLTAGRWFVVNLSTFEKNANGDNGIHLPKVGHTQYFECEIDFRLTTLTREAITPAARANGDQVEILIPTTTFHSFKNLMLTETELLNQIKSDIEAKAGPFLDRVVLPGMKNSDQPVSITSLDTILTTIQLRATAIADFFSIEVAKFESAAANSLALDRQAEFERMLAAVWHAYTPLREQFEIQYELARNLNSGARGIRDDLKQPLQDALDDAFRSVVNPSASGASIHIGLHDLVKLTITEVKVKPTDQALELQKEIRKIFDSVQTARGDAFAKMSECAAKYGADTKAFTLEILKSGRVPASFRRVVGSSLGQAALPAEAASTTEGQGIPVATLPAASTVSVKETADAGATSGAASGPDNAAAANTQPAAATAGPGGSPSTMFRD